MYPWNCCRTCLSSESLNPIFPEFEKAEKYSGAVFAATGLTVDPNDYLPQQMCSHCIEFINKSKEFRKKAIESHHTLLKRLNRCKKTNEIVLNTDDSIKTESNGDILPPNCVEDDLNDRFSDDDDITLDHFKSVDKFNDESLQNVANSDQKESNKLNTECDSKQSQDFNPMEVNFDKIAQIDPDVKKNNNTTTKKTVNRKPRSKKTDTEDKRREKKERVKESIECEYCHKILTSKLSLRNHYKIHTGFDVVCEHCGKKFITRRLLLMHCRAKHGYEKTDKCSYCDYKASNAEQVKIHERLHTGEKPYKCAECSDAFHRKSSYLQHIATHLKEKTVQCDECPARFKSVTLMRIHRYRHRPPAYSFRCAACGKSFARRRNAARHALHTHQETSGIVRVKNHSSIGP